MTTKYAKGWYYRYDYNFPTDICVDNQIAQVSAYALGKCVYDPTFASYVNVTCDSNYAYVKRYGSGVCTGGSSTAVQPLACEGAFHAYFGCTPNTDWTTFIPTNGVYGVQQYFTSSEACDGNDATVDLANSSMNFMYARINGTCGAESYDQSEQLIFPVDYKYTTSPNCTTYASVTTWSLTCSAATNGRYYSSLAVDFTVPSQPPTPLPTQAPTLPSDTNSNDDNSSEFGGLSQTYWIIIAVGGFVVLVALVGFGSWYCLRAKPKKENALLDNYQTSA